MEFSEENNFPHFLGLINIKTSPQGGCFCCRQDTIAILSHRICVSLDPPSIPGYPSSPYPRGHCPCLLSRKCEDSIAGHTKLREKYSIFQASRTQAPVIFDLFSPDHKSLLSSHLLRAIPILTTTETLHVRQSCHPLSAGLVSHAPSGSPVWL